MNGGPDAAVDWVWRARSPLAMLTRAALLPAAGLYRLGSSVRNAAYDAGLLRSSALPVPSVGIGNLSVGGTGKTPLAMFAAQELLERGLRPGIVLRGYGGDEIAEHRAASPSAVVESGADRHAAAAAAVERGAEVLVLDDCLQRRDVVPDVMLALVSAETWTGLRWPLPAGPWREGVGALRRADAVVVTRKLASQQEAERLAAALAGRTRGRAGIVAALEPGDLVPLRGGAPQPVESLRGRDLVAVAGIGEPDMFAAAFERKGARVRLLAFGDHHAYTADEVAWIVKSMPRDGVAITTAKDAVKLAPLWPAGATACLVARLRVTITAGADRLGELLDRAATAARRKNPGTAAAPSVRES